MNLYAFLAGVLTFLLSAIHSLLGEKLIFRHIAKGGLREADALALFPARRWASMRSTWHLVSLMGCGLGALLVAIGTWPTKETSVQTTKAILATTFLVCALYWVLGTRGKHPAWIVMVIIAGLALLAK